jgi:hypothetical protein
VLHTDADQYGTQPILYVEFISDPPVARDQWERVQERLRGNPRRGGRKRSDPAYLLGGLVVCAHCGFKFYGNRMHREREGERYLYYRHHDRESDGPRCDFESLMVNVAQLHAAALRFTRAALAAGGLRVEAAAELRRQRGLAGTQDAAAGTERLRKVLAKYEAAAERASDNAATTEVDSARHKHLLISDKFSRLADTARLELAAAETATTRFARAEARLASETLGDPAAADELECADAATRRRIVQSVVREVRIDLGACSAEFLVVALS